MKRMSLFLCAAAVLLMAGSALSGVYAQSHTGRALFAYPMQGQTPEQENIDRAECHAWAVAQTGFDPTLVPPPAPRGGVLAGRAINAQPGPTGSGRGIGGPGGMSGARTNAEIRALNQLYDDYPRAGQVCLEGRGYQVTR